MKQQISAIRVSTIPGDPLLRLEHCVQHLQENIGCCVWVWAEVETIRSRRLELTFASSPPPPRSLISFWRPPIPSDCTNPARSSRTAESCPPRRIPFHVDEVLSRITASPYPPPPRAPFAVAATVHSNTVLDPNTAIE